MNATLLRHLVFEQTIDQPVTGGLHLALEGLGRDLDPEVRLPRRAARHSFMVGVLVRVVEDLEASGTEG